MNFISVNELQLYAPEVDFAKYDTTTVSGVISLATGKVESYIGYTLPYEVKTEKLEAFVNSDDDLVVFPNKRPVRSLSSLSIVKANFSADITLTSGGDNLYDIVDENQIVVPGSTISLNTVSLIDFAALKRVRFWVNATYGCGYYMYDRPAELIDAVVLYSRDWFARSSNTAGAKSISQGGVSITYFDSGGKSDFVKDAETILEDYKLISGF